MVGQAGMGAVYKATDTRIQGRICATKEMGIQAILPQERAQAVQNFEQEAQLLAKLKHPCLPQVHDFFQDGGSGRYYLVMDFVEGETLSSILSQQGVLPEDVVRVWGSQLCGVLHYLHQQSPPIIFRDLKPGNIMLDTKGQIKLIDFGIARFFKPAQTKDTQVIGTPGFAAPEQYGQGQTDTRSDIYGLGVTLLTLLTGYDPAQNPFALPEASQLNPAVSAQMTAVIQQATQIKPEQRWQSTVDMQEALTTGSLAKIAGGDARGSSKWWWLVGVFLLLGLFGVGGWVFNQNNDGVATAVPAAHEALETEITRVVVVTNTALSEADEAGSEEAAGVGKEPATQTPHPPTPVPSPTPGATVTQVEVIIAAPSPTHTPVLTAPDRIVFQSNRDGDYEIYIVNVDGSNLQKLTDNNVDDKYPAVSPDGRRIAYQVGGDENWGISVMDVDGGNRDVLSDNRFWDRLPTWSPDGQQIAFISNRNGQFAVHMMDANGQNVRQVVNTGERDGHVSWSVNDKLAFNTGGDSSKTWRIAVSDVNGDNVQNLTGNGNWSPEWSPDGRFLVFVSSRSGGDTNPGIFVMNADGSNQRQLFDSPDYEWGARWSGDGQSIIFTRSPNNKDSIYMVPVQGGTSVLIMEGGSYPAWVNGR